jgi:hypothetical protein
MKRRRNPFTNSYVCSKTPHKIRYLKASFAWAVGARQVAKTGTHLYVYRCDGCHGGWHLTSKAGHGAVRIETKAGLTPDEREAMSKVIDINEKRAERGEEGFRLLPWDFDDDALGFIPGDHPVVFVFDGNDGIAMTKETVEKLRDALTGVLSSPHAPWMLPSEGTGHDK